MFVKYALVVELVGIPAALLLPTIKPVAPKFVYATHPEYPGKFGWPYSSDANGKLTLAVPVAEPLLVSLIMKEQVTNLPTFVYRPSCTL